MAESHACLFAVGAQDLYKALSKVADPPIPSYTYLLRVSSRFVYPLIIPVMA